MHQYEPRRTQRVVDHLQTMLNVIRFTTLLIFGLFFATIGGVVAAAVFHGSWVVGAIIGAVIGAFISGWVFSFFEVVLEWMMQMLLAQDRLLDLSDSGTVAQEPWNPPGPSVASPPAAMVADSFEPYQARTTTATRLFSSPDRSSPDSEYLVRGTALTVFEVSTDRQWAKVATEKGLRGFIPTESILLR